MSKNHLKRHFANKRWNLLRKIEKFVTRSLPGKHALQHCVPLGWFLKNAGLVSTTKEAKKMLQFNNVQIDKKQVKEVKCPVGFMDVVSVNDKSYRCTFDQKGKVSFIDIDAKEAGLKICKIINKTKNKKGKTQLNFIDGRNLMIEKEDYKAGDSLVLELPSQKIVKHLPFKEGAIVLLTSGKNAGKIGKMEKILDHHIWYKDAEGNQLSTSKKYGFVVGLEKPEIKVQ